MGVSWSGADLELTDAALQAAMADDLASVQAELAVAQRRAERGEAEAALARQLLAELRLAPRERGEGGSAERRRRKAGGQAPLAGDTPSDTPAEPPAEVQGASAPSPDNSSNSSNGSDNEHDDSKH
ncbi:hypothetical protein [Cupriavidus sp. amp6]|uniref:hypothetical protein n=1 Tax=Cupriavidus sp. amp6 TaxID=388051 RepID=UPI0003FFD228|nr:hypothetical protein [Cupriavidus sp. amp6]